MGQLVQSSSVVPKIHTTLPLKMSPSFVLTTACKDAIRQTLLEQGLEKLSWESSYEGKSSVEFVGWLIHTYASMIEADTQARVDMIMNVLYALNRNVEKGCITQQQVDQTLLTWDVTRKGMCEALSELVTAYLNVQDKEYCNVNEITNITYIHVLCLQKMVHTLEQLDMKWALIDNDFIQTYPFWWGMFLNHLAGLHRLIPNLKLQSISPLNSNEIVQTRRLLEAFEIGKFYLTHVNE